MTTIYIKKEDLPERRKNDIYPTESDLIVKALECVYVPKIRNILDIGAGDGRWGREVKKLEPTAKLHGIDIVGDKPEGFDYWVQNDYLQYNYSPFMFDLIVSNPPYYIAEKIVRKAWEELAPEGEMVFLLRLSFQAGVGRAKNLWQNICPFQVGVVSRRPSFYGRGTNGTDYGVYYWKKTFLGDCLGDSGVWDTFLLIHEREPLKKEKNE